MSILSTKKWYDIAYYVLRGDFMKPLKTKVSITLDADIIEQIKSIAEDDDRSLSQYVNLILRKYIEKSQSEEENK